MRDEHDVSCDQGAEGAATRGHCWDQGAGEGKWSGPIVTRQCHRARVPLYDQRKG